jgi:hypothetical protein
MVDRLKRQAGVLLFLFLIIYITPVMSLAKSNSFSTVQSVCACGRIQLETARVSSLRPAITCHCRRCRKYHLTAFTSYIQVEKDHISIAKGNDQDIRVYQDSCDQVGRVDRWQCVHCHSKLVTQIPQESTAWLNMGPLDDESITSECCEKWKSSAGRMLRQKAAWVDAIPQAKRRIGGRPPPVQIQGGCACGKSRYQLQCSFGSELQHCYCKLCHQLSGGPFPTWVPVSRDRFQWQTEEPPLIRTTPHGRRHICEGCGGVLTIVYDNQSDLIWPAAGGFDDDTVPPEISRYLGRVIHICCLWKQAWYDIPSDGMQRIDYAC